MIIVWASPSTGHAGGRNGQIRVENKNCQVFGNFPLVVLMFGAFVAAFSASFLAIKRPTPLTSMV